MFQTILLIINSAYIAFFLFYHRDRILDKVSDLQRSVNLKFRYYIGTFESIETFNRFGNMFFSSNFSTYSYNTTLSGPITATNISSNATISGTNLSFSNNIQSVTLDELIKLKEDYLQLKRDFYQYIIKNGQKNQELENQKEK